MQIGSENNRQWAIDNKQVLTLKVICLLQVAYCQLVYFLFHKQLLNVKFVIETSHMQ